MERFMQPEICRWKTKPADCRSPGKMSKESRLLPKDRRPTNGVRLTTKEVIMSTNEKKILYVKMDETLRNEFVCALEKIGLNYKNAVRCLAYQIVYERGLPFEPEAVFISPSGKAKTMRTRIDAECYDMLSVVLKEMELDFSTAVNLFACQTIIEGVLPFAIKGPGRTWKSKQLRISRPDRR